MRLAGHSRTRSVLGVLAFIFGFSFVGLVGWALAPRSSHTTTHRGFVIYKYTVDSSHWPWAVMTIAVVLMVFFLVRGTIFLTPAGPSSTSPASAWTPTYDADHPARGWYAHDAEHCERGEPVHLVPRNIERARSGRSVGWRPKA